MSLPLFVGVLCLSLFVMHYFVSILVLQSSQRGRENWSLCYYCLTDVLLLYVFCGIPSRFHGLVCTVTYVIVVFPDHTHYLFDKESHADVFKIHLCL